MIHLQAKAYVLSDPWQGENRLAPNAAIEAVLPVYDEQGAGVEILLQNGSRQVVACGMRTLLGRLARRSCRTIPLIRAQMRQCFGGRQELPVPISPDFILVPCKVRVPRVRGDATLGYFSLMQVHALDAEEHGASLRLSSGRVVPFLCTFATARQRLLMADYVRQRSLAQTMERLRA